MKDLAKPEKCGCLGYVYYGDYTKSSEELRVKEEGENFSENYPGNRNTIMVNKALGK
jgi:hypothetical protein